MCVCVCAGMAPVCCPAVRHCIAGCCDLPEAPAADGPPPEAVPGHHPDQQGGSPPVACRVCFVVLSRGLVGVSDTGCVVRAGAAASGQQHACQAHSSSSSSWSVSLKQCRSRVGGSSMLGFVNTPATTPLLLPFTHTGAAGVPCSGRPLSGRTAAGGGLHPAHTAHQQPRGRAHPPGSHGRAAALWGGRG